MNNYKYLIEELQILYLDATEYEVRAYYRETNGMKFFYDFQLIKDDYLGGNHEYLSIDKLIYFLKEQNQLIEYC